MQEFLQQLVNGITWGSIYALIALGYTMVYGILRLINFAHGDVYMVGAFTAYFAARLFGAPAPVSLFAAALVLLLAMAVSAIMMATLMALLYIGHRLFDLTKILEPAR